MYRSWQITACVLSLILFVAASLQAQIDEKLYRRDHWINPANRGKLLFELDNLSFFKNDEFEGDFQKGYTLPGTWVQPKFIYFPRRNIKLELGGHFLFYWGAKNYPVSTYTGIPTWQPRENSKTFAHILPFVRLQMELYKHVQVVFGDIYGGASHQLCEPLYNPEYNLTADPETGFQLLLDYRHFTLDGWVNWQNFIFKGDDRQEVFMAGISSRILFHRPESRLQVYIPLQMLFRHQGGEIDSVDAGIQTWLNLAAGAGISYRLNKKGFVRKIGAEAMGTYFSQQSGKVLSIDNGYGINARLFAESRDFKLSMGYWRSDDFYSISGSPFFSAVSSFNPQKTFRKPSMLYGTLEYTRTFGQHYAFGADLSVYHHLSMTSMENIFMGNNLERLNVFQNEKAATSITFGVYLRINPSFLLKDFRKCYSKSCYGK